MQSHSFLCISTNSLLLSLLPANTVGSATVRRNGIMNKTHTTCKKQILPSPRTPMFEKLKKERICWFYQLILTDRPKKNAQPGLGVNYGHGKTINMNVSWAVSCVCVSAVVHFWRIRQSVRTVTELLLDWNFWVKSHLEQNEHQNMK